MPEILAIALHAMQQDATRLERVGMNLANALTPGYKRSVVSIAPGFSQQVETVWSAARGAPTEMALHEDRRPGALKSTGQALDVALTGPGYLEVQTPQGLLYTRRGELRLDGHGRLVTSQGDPVMGLGGEIFLSSADPRIDETGRIFDSRAGTPDAPTAQLRLVSFEDPNALQAVGEGYLSTSDAASTAVLADISHTTAVKQGYLENANVNSMQEMVQLIQTMRHFESMQRVAVGYDDMLGSAIRKLGELS